MEPPGKVMQLEEAVRSEEERGWGGGGYCRHFIFIRQGYLSGEVTRPDIHPNSTFWSATPTVFSRNNCEPSSVSKSGTGSHSDRFNNNIHQETFSLQHC